MPKELIAGASRGIGLELARQYAEDGWTIYAGCRNPERASAMHQMTGAVGNKLRIVRMDANSENWINCQTPLRYDEEA